MSEKHDSPFDPDATLKPQPPAFDPDATLKPQPPAFDPDATLQPVPPEFDPDITVNSPLAMFDPEATVGITSKKRRRANPFAPKALPEALQANLAALGGINPLVAFANPVFGVMPEIRAAQMHPDPELLKETLQDLIEAFEAGASAAGLGVDTVEAAVYALCCLADDSAAATPWGENWPATGLLQRMRGETRGGEEFFGLLEEVSKYPERNSDLLEFLYICLALGFEGRYRQAGNAKADLDKFRAGLHAQIVRRRPRPVDGLSGQWRGVTAAGIRPRPADKSSRRWILGAAVGLVVLVAGYAFLRPPLTQPEVGAPVPAQAAPGTLAQPPASQPATSPASHSATATATQAASQPASRTLRQILAAAIADGSIALHEAKAGATIALRSNEQFSAGGVEPEAGMLPVIERIAVALDEAPGTILVIGHADSTPVNARLYASNHALSAARAEAVARLIAAKMREPQRVQSRGVGTNQPLAPNDSEENRARNRRVEIRMLDAATQPAVKPAVKPATKPATKFGERGS